MNNINLLLIGIGPHARRIYYPILIKEGKQLGARVVYGVELITKKKEVRDYFQKMNAKIPVYYVDNEKYTKELSKDTINKLDEIIKNHEIKGVIISTDPTSHFRYASWALDRGLNILMDKPISAVPNLSTSEESAKELLSDYKYLSNKYKKSKIKNKNVFSVVAQRRYHPIYIEIGELVKEIFNKTNCPITSVQAFHADGQWRLPPEIIDITYHSFNQGYGKYLHTGYHSLDTISWLLKLVESPNKKINNIEVFAQITRPSDYITQLNLKDHRNLFSKFNSYNRYTEGHIKLFTKKHGEIDAFTNIAFMHNDDVITLASINLAHNSFSQRGWLYPKEDLYKGNGRVRHESLFIEQGPFQAISLISYQSKEIRKRNYKNFNIGGEYHLDVHVFRNNNFYPKWKIYKKISTRDLYQANLRGYSRGHQEEARRSAVVEFIQSIKGLRANRKSDLLSHKSTVELLSAIYRSVSRKFHNKNPVVRVPY